MVIAEPTLSTFLKAATDIGVFAWRAHHDGDGDGDDGCFPQADEAAGEFSSLVRAVRSSVEAFLTTADAEVGTLDPLASRRSCRVIARNLIIRVERVCQAQNDQSRVSWDRRVFCESWPVDDIEALHLRLSQTIEKMKDYVDLTELEHCRQRLWASTGDDDARELSKTPPSSLSSHVEQMKIASAEGLKGLHTRQIPKANTCTAPASVLNEFILDSLAFKSMHDREDSVTRAHAKTLEWLFSPPGTTSDHATSLSRLFNTWLASDDLGPVFWITGKPGSGKSTFMQFLYQHEAAATQLKVWAGAKPVLTASFFFWTSGSREQRSQTGLLRYLLHQMLSFHPEYMPKTFPSLWDKLSIMSTKERIQLSLEWTAMELQDAFQAFMDVALEETKVCLFIDGVDEFEGDHTAIINFFQDLTQRKGGKDVKLCLSSRPWEVFERAFEHKVPTMRLQDVTYDDMYHYAVDRLLGNTTMTKVLSRTDPLERLGAEIVRSADGVFLWARLAVNELLERLTRAGQQDFDPYQTLASLPTDLYQLFDRLIFEDQTETQISLTSVLFQLLRAREMVADFVKNEEANSLTIWEFLFALSEEPIPAHVREMSDEDVISWCEPVVESINQRFSRLVEAHEKRERGNMKARFDLGASKADVFRRLADSRVTFIHRTVRDWLMYEPGVREQLLRHSPQPYDPHLQLLRSYVLRLKHPSEQPEHHRRLDEWYPDIALALTHARHIRNDPTRLQRTLVNEMNSTLGWYWLRKPKDPYDHWARNAFGQYEVRMKAAPIFQPFLCLAAKFQLTRYLHEELTAAVEEVRAGKGTPSQLEDERAVPLLSYATEFLCSRKKTIFPVSDPELVAFLLHHSKQAKGLCINPGPNHEYTEFTYRYPITPWVALLKHLRDARRRGWIEHYDGSEEGVERWTRIVHLFLDARAEAGAVVRKDMWDPEITARGVLELLDDEYADYRIQEIKARLETSLVS